MIDGKNPLEKKSRGITTAFVAVVLIASLLSTTVSSNGYAMQNVGVFMGLLPASANSASATDTGSVLDGFAQFIGVAYAAKPSSGSNLAANIDQCTNGGVSMPIEPCRVDNTYSNWVNGNSNGQKSHWNEGQFISYRVTVTGLDGTATEHTLRIQYDTVHGGKHAIDYLGSFDATETTSTTSSTTNYNHNNPCLDKLPAAQCNSASPADALAIPAASLVNCGGSAGTTPTQASGSIAIFGSGGDITGITYPNQNVVSGQGQCATTMDIKFKATGSTVVIAWGGHIASEASSAVSAPISGWGAGNSASFISGSPYHMALVSLDTASTGSQDRALATSAVVFTPTITTRVRRNSDDVDVTNASVANGTVVHDTAILIGASSNAGGSVVYKFYNNDSCTGTAVSQETKSVTNGLVQNSSSVTLTAGFGGTSSYCFIATYSGDSKNIGPVTSPIEPVTVNPPPAGTVTIIKDTVPDDGTDFSFTTTGGLVPSSFILDDEGGSDSAHSNSQTFNNVLVGTYNVTETANLNYRTTVACVDSTNDSTPSTSTLTNKTTINVSNGDTITCTFTNTKLGTITIIKDTQPDDASVFSFTSDIASASAFMLDDDGNAGNTYSNQMQIPGLLPGNYSVTEALSAYGVTVSCTDTDNGSTGSASVVATRTATIDLDAGESITCTFINTKLSTKITAFGYTNTPTGLPSLANISGTTTYKVNVTNFGGADTFLNVTLALGHDTSLGGGHLTYVGYTGSTATTVPIANCDAGCSIEWKNLSLAKSAVLEFTVTITYDQVPDGTVITSDLDSTFNTILGGTNFVRTVNGSHAAIDFTAQIE